MCKCDGFEERQNFFSLREYRDTVRQLIELVASGRFLLVEALCPLEDTLNTQPPGDTIFHKFECPDCGRRFQLFVDTYHGHANWRPESK